MLLKLQKKAGLWNFMDDVDNLIIPDDLQLVLMECQPALGNF
jgi:uncharacterized protein YdeI (YjbR/CyaY-like superfamily)